MRRVIGRPRELLITAAVLFFSCAAGLANTNSCVSCHEDSWDELKTSVHGAQGIRCESCHGGDPAQTEMEAAKAPGTGYIGIPDKKQIVERCGACHADVETMNFYGIRTDQLARYKTSRHGKKLLGEGDERVAACTDCHGYHDIAKVSEPASRVHPLNIPATCNECHGDAKLMSNYNLPSNAYALYRDSVHGKALLEKKDLSAAQCASCHGSHGAMPPGVRSIGDTCGKCHMNEKKYFLESPHAKLAAAGRFSECASCHGNHAVHHPTAVMAEEFCIKCHTPDSEPMQRGRRLRGYLEESERAYERAESAVKQASIDGFFVEEEEALLEEVKTGVLEMQPLQHTLDAERIGDLRSKTVATAEKIQNRVEAKRDGRVRRKVILAGIWVFILIMVGALWTKYKQLKGTR